MEGTITLVTCRIQSNNYAENNKKQNILTEPLHNCLWFYYNFTRILRTVGKNNLQLFFSVISSITNKQRNTKGSIWSSSNISTYNNVLRTDTQRQLRKKCLKIRSRILSLRIVR